MLTYVDLHVCTGTRRVPVHVDLDLEMSHMLGLARRQLTDCTSEVLRMTFISI